MDTERELVDLVGMIYEASTDPGLWVPFLQELQRRLGMTWCFFFLHDFERSSVNITAQVGIDPEFLRSYGEYYASKNVFLIHGKEQLRPGIVCPTNELCPERIFRHSEFFADWGRPQDMGHGINATVLRTEGMVGLFGLLRRLGDAPCGSDDVNFVRLLMPHLQRASQLHLKWADLIAREEATCDILDRWHQAMVVVDARARVVSLNRAAKQILERRDGLWIGRHGLETARAAETNALLALVRECAGCTPNCASGGGLLKVPRTKDDRHLELMISPLAGNRFAGEVPGAACVVFITDPAATSCGAEHLLKDLYGLTPSESRVAMLLASGKSVREISQELEVASSTIRAHVKKVLEKTQTHRQSDFVRLLLTGLTSIRPRDDRPGS